MRKHWLSNQTGQALVSLMVFVAIAITVAGGAVAATIINLQAGSENETGQETLRIAEAGAENAVIRLLRDPNYGNQNYQVGNGSVDISVSGSDPKTITSIGKIGTVVRKIQVVGSFYNQKFTQTSWNEIY